MSEKLEGDEREINWLRMNRKPLADESPCGLHSRGLSKLVLQNYLEARLLRASNSTTIDKYRFYNAQFFSCKIYTPDIADITVSRCKLVTCMWL